MLETDIHDFICKEMYVYICIHDPLFSDYKNTFETKFEQTAEKYKII